jgi:hypothetical protein
LRYVRRGGRGIDAGCGIDAQSLALHGHRNANLLPALARLLGRDERGEFVAWLVANPEAGAVIRGSGGCRKVRWARSGSGKRGGVRVIHYNRLDDGVIYLLLIYAKNVRDNFDAGTLNRIRRTLNGKDD